MFAKAKASPWLDRDQPEIVKEKFQLPRLLWRDPAKGWPWGKFACCGGSRPHLPVSRAGSGVASAQNQRES